MRKRRSRRCFILNASSLASGGFAIARYGKAYPLSVLQTFAEGDLELLLAHFRKHFDDIHDVSMRFHHKDHNLNGVIEFRMKWEQGRLADSRVIRNETGDPGFAEALLGAMKDWVIMGLEAAFETNLPVRIKLVGSDDPTFAEKAIVTGRVLDRSGDPIHGARVDLISVSEGLGEVPPCHSNREGIFVRTLVPPGTWELRCSREGFEEKTLEDLELLSGEHHRVEIVLGPSSEDQ